MTIALIIVLVILVLAAVGEDGGIEDRSDDELIDEMDSRYR